MLEVVVAEFAAANNAVGKARDEGEEEVGPSGSCSSNPSTNGTDGVDLGVHVDVNIDVDVIDDIEEAS